jgi:hypothetical protein
VLEKECALLRHFSVSAYYTHLENVDQHKQLQGEVCGFKAGGFAGPQ